MLTKEQSDKLIKLAATHIVMSRKEGRGFKGTTVQVTLWCDTAVLFMGMTPAEVEALNDEEFERLCFLTDQTPNDLDVSGALDLKHGATFTDRRDALEDEY